MLKHVKKEARSFTRIRFSTRADVEVNGVQLHGDVMDMSMGGIYMRTASRVQIGDPCEVRIMLGNDDPMVLHALGHVARCDAHGFALAFSGFYCDSDSCLRQMILHTTGNRPEVQEEMDRAPNLSLINPARD